ncbi:MAG: hypothetical protein MHMPM18_003181 [Marteilia pararefringens]
MRFPIALVCSDFETESYQNRCAYYPRAFRSLFRKKYTSIYGKYTRPVWFNHFLSDSEIIAKRSEYWREKSIDLPIDIQSKWLAIKESIDQLRVGNVANFREILARNNLDIINNYRTDSFIDNMGNIYKVPALILGNPINPSVAMMNQARNMSTDDTYDGEESNSCKIESVRIRFMNDVLRFAVDGPDQLIKDIRTRLKDERKEDVRDKSIVLLYDGKILVDQCTLRSYRMKDNTMIDCILF